MTKPHRPLLVVAGIAALTLAGCSTLPAIPAPGGTRAAAAPTPTPTPTIWTTQEAAAYLHAVCPVNKLVLPFNTALQNADFATLNSSATSTASQRLRSRLGLPADQMAGC